MLLTPQGRGGNAFNTWTRTANQFEALPTFRLSRKTWHGSHDLKIGLDVVHGSYTGTSQSRPIQILREDGSLARRIDFRAAGLLHGANIETSAFAQDHWVLKHGLTIDSGVRLSSQSNGRSVAFTPRAGLSYSLGADHKTVFHAGAGFFYDRVSLLATTFEQNPIRVVSSYDQAGLIAGKPLFFQNVYLDRRPTSPRNVSWTLAVDHKLNSAVTVRLSYLQSQTSEVYVISPRSSTAGYDTLLGLTQTGNSHYREFQASLSYRLGKRGEVRVTYIHSRSRGDLNTLSSTFVPFEQPIIRPNVYGYLTSDIPNRLLSAGIFQLPWNLTVSPAVDLRTGFRYSEIDELQDYVGTPNSHRFPVFFSLDAKIYRDFRLPAFAGFIKDRRLRIGVYTLNLTNHSNPRDVFNNVASPEFGHFVGFRHRVNGLLIDLVK